jgi:hypothetical protein
MVTAVRTSGLQLCEVFMLSNTQVLVSLTSAQILCWALLIA